MKGDLATAERDLGFPIPLDILGEFYLAEPDIVLDAVRALSASKRAKLVLACRRHPELSGVAAELPICVATRASATRSPARAISRHDADDLPN